MKQFSYGERDHVFGQRMLTLRSAIGLTQADLARHLGVSRKAIGGWEIGESYPTADHLKALLALALRASAFPAGREEEEIRTLWQAAHQKVLLDEALLAALLSQLPAMLAAGPVNQDPGPDDVPADPIARCTQVDWWEAPAVPRFFDREQELATLCRWMVQEGCRMVNVLGMGGIGKSALVVHAMQRLAGHFEVVIFRSLRDAPSCEALLESCLQVLSPGALPLLAQGLEPRMKILLQELRRRRVLLVFDNLEDLLQAGDLTGRLREGFEAYGRLLRQVAESGHQSCLLLTSREKPTVLRGLMGNKLPVRTLRLSGLDVAVGEQLLAEYELTGSHQERVRLIQAYSGNPLALKIVAQIIVDLFGGEINHFLSTDAIIFGEITELFDEQWARLSPLEQTVLCWLATLREPVSLEEMQAALVAPLAPAQLLEAVEGLRRRSLIERGQRTGSFTLHSVVLEYVTGRVARTAGEEIRQGRLSILLPQTQARDLGCLLYLQYLLSSRTSARHRSENLLSYKDEILDGVWNLSPVSRPRLPVSD